MGRGLQGQGQFLFFGDGGIDGDSHDRLWLRGLPLYLTLQ